MNRSRRVLLAIVLLAGVLAMIGLGQAPAREKAAVPPLMKRKLDHSQKLLEGLALNDFKSIAENAQQLLIVSKEAEWRVLKTPPYEVFSNDFRRRADEMVKFAEDKNIDGAALAYVELTLTCVKCHKHVREVRMARAD